MSATGQSFSVIGREWDIPRLIAWRNVTQNLPSLQWMIGHFCGYLKEDDTNSGMTQEEHAARLLNAFHRM